MKNVITRLYNDHVGSLTHITHGYVFYGVIIWSTRSCYVDLLNDNTLQRFGASRGLGKDLLWNVWDHID